MSRQKRPNIAPGGRGSISNMASQRFTDILRANDGDWQDAVLSIDGAPPPLRTLVTEEFPKSILTFNGSPDLPFDRSVNAYRGCEHGCIYCYARPSHAYHDLSPGRDFESRLFAKPNAADLLRKTLAKPAYKAEVIAIGTNTDPYQPIERRYRITRDILALMAELRHPIAITTKSDRVLADIDLLQDLARDGLTVVAISLTTLDPTLARIMEPRAAHPAKRLQAMQKLSAAGVPVHASIAPIVPAITDHEIEALAKAAATHGARSISAIPLRLPHEVAPLFEEWLEVHFPDRAARVMALVAEMRSGKANDPAFFTRMKGTGPWAELLQNRMRIAARRNGLNQSKLKLRTDLFQRPAADARQLALF